MVANRIENYNDRQPAWTTLGTSVSPATTSPLSWRLWSSKTCWTPFCLLSSMSRGWVRYRQEYIDWIYESFCKLKCVFFRSTVQNDYFYVDEIICQDMRKWVTNNRDSGRRPKFPQKDPKMTYAAPLAREYESDKSRSPKWYFSKSIWSDLQWRNLFPQWISPLGSTNTLPKTEFWN